MKKMLKNNQIALLNQLNKELQDRGDRHYQLIYRELSDPNEIMKEKASHSKWLSEQWDKIMSVRDSIRKETHEVG
jgi:hypothetical protein